MTEGCPGPGPWGLERSWGRRLDRGSRPRGLKRGALWGLGALKPLALPPSLGVRPLSSRDVTVWYQMPKSKLGPSAVSLMTPDRKLAVFPAPRHFRHPVPWATHQVFFQPGPARDPGSQGPLDSAPETGLGSPDNCWRSL